MAELRRVRTGPTSYLKLNEADYKAWKAAGNEEYKGARLPADDDQPTVADPNAEPDSKAMDAPAENKAMKAPAAKKAKPE